MSDRHFELPTHPNLEYYRKQAKHLYSPRNTDSGPGPSSARTSRAGAPPTTGRSPAGRG
jgi:hypothetical protein